jgi:hypothetical protein
MNECQHLNRRGFLAVSTIGAAICAARAHAQEAAPRRVKELEQKLGITTSSLSGHLAPQRTSGKLTLLEVPRLLRDELDLTVIDLNTSTLASLEPAYLDRVRDAAEKAGCVLTNLKLNQRDVDMNSPDKDVRTRALAEYKRSIDAAARLGCRWARPLPSAEKPDMDVHVASYRELCEYAAERKVQMLVENYGWMDGDPDSVPRLIRAVDRDLAAAPDTGNWSSDEVRFAGLAKAFPLAVTCDFKARELGPKGEHPLYDLKRCFEIGWESGFRGPWCFEHANADRAALLRELALLRDMLRKWMAA